MAGLFVSLKEVATKDAAKIADCFRQVEWWANHQLTIGSIYVGSPPSGSGVVLYPQAGSTVQAYATGGTTLTLPSPYPGGIVTVTGNAGDTTSPLLVTFVRTTSKNSFKYQVWNNGVEIAALTNFRLNWHVLGF